MSAERIAQALGNARRNGAGWSCRCPLEDHKKSARPLSIRDGDEAEIVVHCFAGCDAVHVLRSLRERGLLDDREPRGKQQRTLAPAIEANKPVDPGKPRRIFDKALPIEGTLVERYLRDARGCTVQPSHDAVRFLAARPPHFSWPSMVSLVTAFADPALAMSVHFTDLLPDGSGKAPVTPAKRTLKGYPTKGGVIRLTGDAEITTRLGVAEGIETSLAVMTAFHDDGPWSESVWCALNAGNMAELPVLPGIEVLTIYADRGKAGEAAAEKLADRWVEAGREVFVAVAPIDDWNPVAA